MGAVLLLLRTGFNIASGFRKGMKISSTAAFFVPWHPPITADEATSYYGKIYQKV